MDHPLKKGLEALLDGLGGLDRLFESVPDTLFWVKDTRFRFVMGNQASAEKKGCRNFSEVVGKTDYDFYPPVIARKVVEDDAWVLKTGKAIVNRTELHIRDTAWLGWHCTTKVPLFDKQGKVIGVAGISRKLPQSSPEYLRYREMSKVMTFISRNFTKALQRKDLAKIAGLSETEFGRRFKKLCGVSPGQFILNLRLESACARLAESHDSIGNIASVSGFYDASVFSRYFRTHMGLTPIQYRKRFSRLG